MVTLRITLQQSITYSRSEGLNRSSGFFIRYYLNHGSDHSSVYIDRLNCDTYV